MREMQWYVYVENFNRKKMEKYNIFEHASFMEDVRKAYKKHRDNFEEFSIEIKRSLRYYFWSKCEWEIVLSPWPEREGFREEKIDVYDQVMLNADVFFKYVWDMAHARKMPVKRSKNE